MHHCYAQTKFAAFLLNFCTNFALQNGFKAQTYIMCGPRHLFMHKQEVLVVMIKGNPAKQLQIADYYPYLSIYGTV